MLPPIRQLCDKERHLLPGVSFEHQGIIRLMETRCHRVLAVLSPRFLESAVNKFLAMFAQALGLGKFRPLAAIQGCPG